MRHRPPGPRGMPHRRALSDPGLVDQPRPRAVIRIRAVPLPGGERRQDQRPRRRAHRADPLQRHQALRLALRRHRRRIGRGQVTHRGLQHPQRLGGTGRGHGLAHRVTSLRDARGTGGRAPLPRPAGTGERGGRSRASGASVVLAGAGTAQAVPGQVGEGGIAIYGHDQVCLGEDATQDVDDALGAADRQAVGVGQADGDRGRAQARALIASAPERMPESNSTGMPSAASTTAGRRSTRQPSVGLAASVRRAVEPRPPRHPWRGEHRRGGRCP